RQADRDGRPVRGDSRAARRLHARRRQGPRRGDHHRRAHPAGPHEHHRDPAGARGAPAMRLRAAIKVGALALAVIVVGFVVIVATRPSEYRVARTVTIAAPAPTVFAQVNDFHKWEAWSPWAKLDPAMKHAYEGAPAGTGAVYTWAGNRQVGEGRMTMTDSRPSELIRIELEFFK